MELRIMNREKVAKVKIIVVDFKRPDFTMFRGLLR